MGSASLPDKSFACAHGADADWQRALDDCLEQLEQASARRGEPEWTLGWVYLSEFYGPATEAILGQLHHRLPGVAWVGTIGMGVATNGIEYIGVPAMTLMVAPLPRESFRVFSGRQPLPSSGFEPYTAQVHADGGTADIDELLVEMSARTTTGYLFGGLSSVRNHAVHIAEGVFAGGLSGVAFGPDIGLVSRVTQGCRPIGPTRTVTRAERNYVVTLDDTPALDCVLHDLGLPQEIGDDDLLQALGSTLVGLVTAAEDVPVRPGQFGADTVVRHVVGVGRKNGLLAIADQAAAGMRLTFCERNAMVAQLDLARIATEVRSEIENDPARKMAGAIYVSCSGRGGPHFGAPHAELQLLQNILGDVALVGFFAGGEIARHHLYGYTGVLSVFTTAK